MLSPGERLFLARYRTRATQREAAEHLRVSRHRYQEMESSAVGTGKTVVLTEPERLRLLRRRTRVTVGEISRALRVTRQWVWKMETGQADPEPLRNFYDNRAL